MSLRKINLSSFFCPFFSLKNQNVKGAGPGVQPDCQGDMQSIGSDMNGIEKLSIIPGFNFYNLNYVLSFSVRQEYEGESVSTYEIMLAMLYKLDRFECDVGLKFAGVRYFKVPEVNGDFYLSEIELENVSADQLEGVNFRFKDYGGSGFEVLSREFSVLSCKPRD